MSEFAAQTETETEDLIVTIFRDEENPDLFLFLRKPFKGKTEAIMFPSKKHDRTSGSMGNTNYLSRAKTGLNGGQPSSMDSFVFDDGIDAFNIHPSLSRQNLNRCRSYSPETKHVKLTREQAMKDPRTTELTKMLLEKIP